MEYGSEIAEHDGGMSSLQLYCGHDWLGVTITETSFCFLKVKGAVDKRDVRESLWIVA